MFNNGEQAWERSDLLEEITVANVEDLRPNRSLGVIQITIHHPDLSEGVSIGRVYVQGTSAQLLEASAAVISAFLGCLEVGIPEAGRTPLSSADLRSTIHRALVVVARLVRRGVVGRW
jgi:hypothetical protein